MLDAFARRSVLMLQGPMGPFFRRVAEQLRQRGATVTKVNFNAGDHLFFRGPGVVAYRGSFAAWPTFFEQLVRERGIDLVLLFGDCRPYHRAAVERARALNVEVYVFEEGYLRPDYVTLERNGVTGNSSIPKDPQFYRKLSVTRQAEPKPVGQTLPQAACYAAGYAITHRLLGWRYPNYRHHRDIRPLQQGVRWLRGGARRLAHGWRDRSVDAAIAAGVLSPFFLVPLQVHLDAQVQHSPFEDVEAFIRLVVRSFARHASTDTSLVLKHHPFDRPYRDYTVLLNELGNRYQLGNRLRYVDVINLPAALREARGTVVINSTVGLSSIHHGTPVKCLGSAIYDIEGLAYQGPLDDFWSDPGTVDAVLYGRFRWWLRAENQVNGSVWRGLIVP